MKEKVEGVVVDEAKMTKRELQKQQLIKFEFTQIRRVYASMMNMGKVTLVVSESEEGAAAVR